MYYCNDFFGLNVLSLYEGELLGVVNKLCFDKKLKKLIAFELVGEDGARLILPSKNIYHVGKNAITVKNNQAVSLKVEETTYSPCPIDSKAYTIKGEYLGIIKEISVNEKYLTEKFSLDNNNTLDVNLLASSSKNTTIFYENQNSVNVKKFTPNKTPKIFKTEKVQTASILPVEEVAPPPPHAVPVEEATKTNQNADFLIGRVCTKDIFNFNNEILIKAHQVVSKKNLKEINKFGKLRELMLYTK